MLNHRWACHGAALAALVFVAMTAAGCGKKADPISPQIIRPPAITGLAADSVAEGILLVWSAAGPIERIDHFRILRGEAAADDVCPGCPQEYRPLATPKIADQKIQRAGEGVFRYVDGTVTAGRFYSYRVSACDSKGQCGEPSVPAQRLLEKR
jgi:hypothetical protein